jgi:hypothetical protein
MYRIVEKNTELQVYFWTEMKHENLYFSSLMCGIHQAGTQKGKTTDDGVTKISMQFVKFSSRDLKVQ